MSLRVVSWFDAQPVKKAYQAKQIKTLTHAGGVIRLIAVRSIRVTKRKASQPGRPPNSRGGFKSLKNAIAYETGERVVFIGVRFSVLGKVGAAHELGTSYRGDNFAARPFMLPALQKALPRLAEFFK